MSPDLDPADLELTHSERNSMLTAKLVRCLQARLEQHRRKNDAENLTDAQTAALRGRIAELKKILDLLAAGERQD